MSALPLPLLVAVTALFAFHFTVWGEKRGDADDQQQRGPTDSVQSRMTPEQMEQELVEIRKELKQQKELIAQLKEENKQKDAAELEIKEKRSDDPDPMESVLSVATQRLDQHDADIEALQNADHSLTQAIAAQDQARGTTYIRWGNAGCSNTSELVYSGVVGGGHSRTTSPANNLCLTLTPHYDGHPVPPEGANHVYGSEYDICNEPECQLTPTCAVCRVPRAATVMVAGSDRCAAGWHLEYTGHIMAGSIGTRGSEYICVDSAHGYLPGTQRSDDQSVLHYVDSRCGSLPCPPYADGRIVTCAVCSK